MTRAQDKVAFDAAKAAQLVKTTAETTATALNIQYIQKDIAEMKVDVKSLAASQDGKVEELQNRLDGLSRTVNVGVGIAIAISTLMPFIIKFVSK